jgi:hypothetical protein
MLDIIGRIVFDFMPSTISETLGMVILKRFTRSLVKEIEGEVTDKFLELLLNGLKLMFTIDKEFRQNIMNFQGSYLFATKDKSVETCAVFKNGRMKVYDRRTDGWDVKVTFKDAQSLKQFIFSRDQDILDSLLTNTVEVDGNLNYLYKFGFMARDLMRRLGIEN